jgi:hypothetical protein
MPAQPPDEWTYLRPEEFADDDAVEQVDAVFETNAEVAAIHLVDVDEAPTASVALDPGETLVSSAAGGARDDPDARYFDDEEPEAAAAPASDDDGVEPSVDDILVSQHYAFGPETT